MGIDPTALKFLARAAREGCSFDRTVTIGRQRLYVDPGRLGELVPGGPAGAEVSEADRPFAEWVLRRLGAGHIDSIDVSGYEGASVLHDLNTPLPAEYHGRYTAVVDCGTIEHIFNFPAAIANCMALAAVGGRVILHTVANNYCGHGFYQFSPELFFRVFSPANGFRVEQILACDGFYESAWYQVADPEAVGRRVEITGPYPVMLLVRAQKVTAVEPFRSPPQQSDYGPAWAGTAVHPDWVPPRRRVGLRSLVPGWLMRSVRATRSARQYASPVFSRTPPG